MKYFRIRHSINTDIGKKWPQVKTGIGEFQAHSNAYIGNAEYFLKAIPMQPELPELVLHDSSKLTDLISSSFTGTSSGLILSDRLKSILESFHPANAQFFPIKIHHKQIRFDRYWYLHPTGANNDLIDFSASEVWEEINLVRTAKRSFTDATTFNEATKNPNPSQSFVITHYSLKNNLPDFFILTFVEGGIGYFISEAAKWEIEEAGCTGIVFTAPNERFP
jgi:hypothetical protein